MRIDVYISKRESPWLLLDTWLIADCQPWNDQLGFFPVKRENVSKVLSAFQLPGLPICYDSEDSSTRGAKVSVNLSGAIRVSLVFTECKN